MRNMKATTVEQSLHLIGLGLKKESSDLYYYFGREDELEVIVNHSNLRDEDVVAWSFDRQLDVMPKSIIINKREYKKVLWQNPTWGDWVIWHEAKHYDGKTHMTARYDHLHTVNNENKITAAYEMVCWLIENGYIKTEEK